MKKIFLTQGQFAMVDDEDYEILSAFKWYAKKDAGVFYAVRGFRVGKKQKQISMHRFLMGNPSKVDHCDGDGLNNQKDNLRVVTHAQNRWNSLKNKNNMSGFKGVYWEKRHKKWRARIRVNGSRKCLGLFSLKEDAAQAYIYASKIYHKEFSVFNR